MQRMFDILFSGIALILLSPLLLPMMFILRVTGEGEVFFYRVVLVEVENILSSINLLPCSKIVLT